MTPENESEDVSPSAPCPSLRDFVLIEAGLGQAKDQGPQGEMAD